MTRKPGGGAAALRDGYIAANRLAVGDHARRGLQWVEAGLGWIFRVVAFQLSNGAHQGSEN